MSKASDSTPNKSSKYQSVLTPSKARVTCANAKEGSSNVIIDATPIIVVLGRVPTKKGLKHLLAKRVKPSNVSESSTPYVSIQIPYSDVRNVESSVAIKKPHTMASLYIEPMKTPNVELDVVTSAKGHIVSNVMGSVGTSKKYASEIASLDNPRAKKILGRSSLNVVVNDTIDKSIHVPLSKILVVDPGSGVVSDVATSLAEPDHPIETTQENSHAESISGEKDDSDDESMYVKGEKNLSDKEESVSVKKYQSTDIVNVDDLDFDDEPIGKILSHGIAKRLKSTEDRGVVVASIEQPLHMDIDNKTLEMKLGELGEFT
ncbi:hypothetical protein KIW84_020507 [Lathyrus oleraceus]|uniref:Uncharacterized protein n=1 Tax=Pisum sativum TaxID=3888 RepID=A0A9D4Y5I4_PEA|nr:hypothetical protein KIW84_020507 [Pisum sativum]